jgi:hypothetical protein
MARDAPNAANTMQCRRLSSLKKDVPQFDEHDQYSSHGCPEADQQQQSGPGTDQLQDDFFPPRTFQQRGDSSLNQENPGNQAQEEKTSPRPAVWEHGK